MLLNNDVPIAKKPIKHKVAHVNGMDAGKTAAELTGKGKDAQAADEIER
jgi:hypothetical protein